MCCMKRCLIAYVFCFDRAQLNILTCAIFFPISLINKWWLKWLKWLTLSFQLHDYLALRKGVTFQAITLSNVDQVGNQCPHNCCAVHMPYNRDQFLKIWSHWKNCPSENETISSSHWSLMIKVNGDDDAEARFASNKLAEQVYNFLSFTVWFEWDEIRNKCLKQLQCWRQSSD